MYLKCVVSVICQFTNPIFNMFSLIVGGQWKGQPSSPFPSPATCTYCLTCVWLHNCEISARKMTESCCWSQGCSLAAEALDYRSPILSAFLGWFTLSVSGGCNRDRNVDFAVLNKITNLSASLFIFIFGCLLTHSLKYIYLQAFLTLILLSFLNLEYTDLDVRKIRQLPGHSFESY